MQLISTDEQCPRPAEGTVVTIGAYDGVHVGHRLVIDEVRRRAAAINAKSALVTFDRHPALVVRPESAPRLLTDRDQKVALLAETGLDFTMIVHFDADKARQTPEEFVRQVLVDCLNARTVVVGEDFHFGHQRRGNVALLRALGKELGFDVDGLELLGRTDGIDEPVSSTAIRRALAGGEVDVAARLLGRPFEVRGEVVQGDQRGRLLGFPTANVMVPDAIAMPADGVYAGWYERPNGDVHPCAVNLGRRPTFYERADHSLLEAHLIGFDGNLYGEQARVRFVAFLRSERKFDGIDALKAQLGHDIESASQILNG
ncbi:MAG: bifunctional riboflavin kinase/FAD synthetase [Acidimicrobiia bacterium]